MLYYLLILSSISLIISLGETFNSAHKLNSTFIVTFLLPLSKRLIYVLSNPHEFANFSCDILQLSLFSLNTSPKIFLISKVSPHINCHLYGTLFPRTIVYFFVVFYIIIYMHKYYRKNKEEIMPKVYSNLFKELLLDELKAIGSISKVAKKYNLSYSSLYKWKKEFDTKITNTEINTKNDYKVEELSFFTHEISSPIKDNHLNDIDKIIEENLLLKSIIINKEIEIAQLKRLTTEN